MNSKVVSSIVIAQSAVTRAYADSGNVRMGVRLFGIDKADTVAELVLQEVQTHQTAYAELDKRGFKKAIKVIRKDVSKKVGSIAAIFLFIKIAYFVWKIWKERRDNA